MSKCKDAYEQLMTIYSYGGDGASWGLPSGAANEPPPKPKCECGMTIALDKEDHPSYHSDWCPVKKEWDKENGGK